MNAGRGRCGGRRLFSGLLRWVFSMPIWTYSRPRRGYMKLSHPDSHGFFPARTWFGLDRNVEKKDCRTSHGKKTCGRSGARCLALSVSKIACCGNYDFDDVIQIIVVMSLLPEWENSNPHQWAVLSRTLIVIFQHNHQPSPLAAVDCLEYPLFFANCQFTIAADDYRRFWAKEL